MDFVRGGLSYGENDYRGRVRRRRCWRFSYGGVVEDKTVDKTPRLQESDKLTNVLMSSNKLAPSLVMNNSSQCLPLNYNLIIFHL